MSKVTNAPGYFESIQRAFQHYSDFEGRSTRPEFWWYALFNVIALSICGLFNGIQIAPDSSVGSILASIFALVTLLPSLAIGVRRLRDSGDDWRNIFWLLVPFAGIIIMAFYWYHPTKSKP